MNPYKAELPREQPIAGRPRTSRLLAWGCATTVVGALLVAAAFVGFYLGVTTANVNHDMARAWIDGREVRSFLAQHSERFTDVEIDASPRGITYLTGVVKSQEDFDLLRQRMQRLFGEKRGEDMTLLVEVNGANAATPKEPDTN